LYDGIFAESYYDNYQGAGCFVKELGRDSIQAPSPLDKICKALTRALCAVVGDECGMVLIVLSAMKERRRK